MNQEVVQTQKEGEAQAVSDLCSQLKKTLSSYSAILFFASTRYDFEKLSSLLHEQFPKAQVIGATTAGEITKGGFSTNSIVLNAIYDNGKSQFSGILIDDIDKFPILSNREIIHAASNIGITLSSENCSRDAFAITLICGLMSAEEIILSQLYSIIKDQNFMIAGGSAGDDMNFKSTSVSCNGVVSSNAAVIMFVKTSCKFKIYKENIFQRLGKNVKLTEVNTEKHLVNAIDGQNPRRRYAQILGITEGQVNDALLDHPFGRVFGDEVFIASLVNFDRDGKLSMYARVLQDSLQEILMPHDPIEMTEKTCRKITSEIPHPSCIILFNCILRTVGFQKKRLTEKINDIWKRYLSNYSGFSTYGEQFGHINSNQTLVALVIGD